MRTLPRQLASAIRSERRAIECALASWIQADPFFGGFRDLPGAEVRLVCRDVLAELDGWLRTDDPTCAIRARLALGCERAQRLARSLVWEHLAIEGVLNPMTHGQRRDVYRLLDSFFLGALVRPLRSRPAQQAETA
ncbi:MAG: hypothetical protein ACYTGN_02595 [Planctomycetota bacterium]|jgi:hypothetical protein